MPRISGSQDIQIRVHLHTLPAQKKYSGKQDDDSGTGSGGPCIPENTRYKKVTNPFPAAGAGEWSHGIKVLSPAFLSWKI